jgi:hypothetical protein
MIEEVRRWRREVYEETKGLSLEERQRRDRELLERLGLAHRVSTTSPSRIPDPPERRAAG